jgi:hypothetical protein
VRAARTVAQVRTPLSAVDQGCNEKDTLHAFYSVHAHARHAPALSSLLPRALLPCQPRRPCPPHAYACLALVVCSRALGRCQQLVLEAPAVASVEALSGAMAGAVRELWWLVRTLVAMAIKGKERKGVDYYSSFGIW